MLTAIRRALASLSVLFQASRNALHDPAGRRRWLIVLAGAFIVAYAVSVLSYVLSLPDIGLRCAFDTTLNRVYPNYLAPDGPKPQANDVIVKLGGEQVLDWRDFVRKQAALRDADFTHIDSSREWTDLHQSDLTHLERDGERWVRVDFHSASSPDIESVWCRVGRAPVEALLPSLLWLLLKFGLFVVGAFVYWKRPDDASAPQFFLLCLVTIGAYVGGYHWLQIVTQPVLILIFMACSVLLPAASWHFYLLFPRPKQFFLQRPRRVLALIYGVPGLFLLVLIGCYLAVRWLYPENATPESLILFRIIRTVVFVYFAVATLWYLACVVSLVQSFRTARDATERNQVKWILFGAVAALVPIGYSLYLAFWNRTAFGGGATGWPMFAASACFTAAFTVSITRYRLMQLDQLISSGFGYFLLSFLAGVLYYVLVFLAMLLGSHVPGPSFGQALWSSGTALVLLLILDAVRSRLKHALDRHFRREKHSLDRTLQRMSQAIDRLVDPPALARRLLQTSAELLNTPRGAVYLREGEPPLYRLADVLGAPPPLSELSPGCPLIEAVQDRGTVAILNERQAIIDPSRRQLRFLGGAVAQPLIHEGRMLALLVLAPKEAGQYTSDDLNLLAAFAQVTALALLSAEGHRTIDALNRELKDKVEKIAEQQRRILLLQSQIRVQGNGAPPTLEPATSPETAGAVGKPGGIVGNSPPVRQLLSQVRKVASSQSEVLIRGESGTGKELLARALHEASPRANKTFVKVHCAALSPGLLESELFGHVKGAFTSAHRDKVGRFEMANGGTLFLDEIGDIDLTVQTKLLRVLQEMTLERVGSSEPLRVDVRVLAATHQNLETLMEQGRFRGDLYYRLNVISLTIPPLRDRGEDIPELVQHFLRTYGTRCNKPDVQIDDDALIVLKTFPWPGNVRQLENVVERAVVFAEGMTITVEDLPPEVLGSVRRSSADSEPGEAELSDGLFQTERFERDRRERELLVRALAAAKGIKADAARALGVPRSTLLSRLKKHGLS
jgi:transcriptional regulator with GAF, ATPase, and Fis domain